MTPVDTRLGALGGTTFRRYPGDVIDEELARETEATSKELEQLNAELREAPARRRRTSRRPSSGSAPSSMPSWLASRRRSLTARPNSRPGSAPCVPSTIAAREEQRQHIQERIDELKASYAARKEKLEEARRLAKASAEKTREALVSDGTWRATTVLRAAVARHP